MENENPGTNDGTIPEGFAPMLGLGFFQPADVLNEQILASLLNRCPTTIKRMVAKGELPPPIKLAGAKCWTVQVLSDHFARRLAEAARERERLGGKLRALRP